MELIEDLGLRPSGSQGRKSRFGIYACPICRNHFECGVDNAKRGKTTKCRSCANKAMAAKASSEFLEKAKAVHGDKYDYTTFQYKGALSKSKFGCRVHGIFEQTPSSHLSGCGCPNCSAEAICKIKVDRAAASFIDKAKAIHGDKYDYAPFQYNGSSTKSKFGCSVHGVFEQTPANHLQGQGCPHCAKERSNIALRMSEKNDRPTLLYYIYFPEVNLWKVGCTTRTLAARFSKEKLVYTSINTKEYISGNEAYRVEKFILDATKEAQFKGNILQSGNSELRTQPVDNFEHLLQEAEESLC